MRKAAVLLIVMLAVTLLVGAFLLESLLVMQRVAVVSDVEGVVMVRPRGQDAFMDLGDTKRVLSGDVIRTGPDGRLTLSWVDKSRIRVDPDTTLGVLKCQVNQARRSEEYLFRLEVGKVWVRVLKSIAGTSKFEIATPTATAAVRGTVFSVEVEPGGLTRVAVFDGQVDLHSGDTQLTVGERRQAAVGDERPAALMDLPEDAQWEQAAEELARPRLTLSEPAADRIPAGAGVLDVRGEVERDARLTVNGAPVEVRPSGRFETQVALPPDEDSFDLTVRAENEQGVATVISRRLSR